MISVADESKVTKTFPMENLSNKKVLSECNQYLGHEVCFNSAKEEDCHFSSYSSNFAKENVPTNAFMFSMMASSLGSPPVDEPVFLGNPDSVTPNKCEGETKTNSEMINQATSSIDFSVLTAADFGISPESFTKYQGKGKSKLKKLRRQSTIGVRGSPGNNALLRYIARQKRMRTEDPPSQASPFQQNLLLKDKIAAFRSSFKVLQETAEEIIHTPYASKKADRRAHEQSQLDQVGPSEYKAVALEETFNCKSTNGEKASIDIQETPVVHPNTVESGHLSLEATSAAGISNTTCGIQSQNTNEELSSSTTSQKSYKKVRFAEKQSLETFDETKPPVTPLQKGHFPSMYYNSSCLHSVLKKTPVRLLAEDVKEHLDYTNMRKGSEELSVFQSCGPLPTERSTRPIEKMEVRDKERDVEVFDPFQPVDAPVCSGEASFIPSGTRNDSSFNTTPIRKPLSQPNFDDDDDLQKTSEVVSTAECVVNSGDTEDKEVKVSSPDLHATCIRTTRSSTKKVNKEEEKSVSLTREKRTKRTRTTSEVPNPRKSQHVNSVTKSASKKTRASRRKAFGKRKSKKKTQKVFHGHYETVSKKPLLSPILEMTEEISLTPEPSLSILDRSCSSLICETPEETNSVLHSIEEDGNCVHSNLSAVKEDVLPDTVPCLFLQLQDAVPNDTQITFPLEPPGNNSSKDLKNTLNEQVLKSNCSSESEMELGLLNLRGTGEKASEEASLLIAHSTVEQPSGGDVCMNVKRLLRRSRRLNHYHPSVEDIHPKTPRNNPCVPRGSMEELPCTPQTVNNSAFLNAIEESFRSITSSTQKRVRRSMRQLKSAESEGLAWISVPTDDSVNQTLVSSDHKTRRKSFAFCHPESEMPHKKQENLAHTLSPMMQDQKSSDVVVEHCSSGKKRKRICSRVRMEIRVATPSIQKSQPWV